MKKQEKKLKVMISESGESRLIAHMSPQSTLDDRANLYKSQQSLNVTNNSMLRGLSPIR